MLKILFLPLDLVKLVEETVRAENARRPNSPIYLIGESFGGCLALAVAARNPQIHFLLMLENPGETNFFFFFFYNANCLSCCSYMFPEVSAAASVVFT